MIKGIKFYKHNNRFDIRVLNETILNLLIVKREVSFKVSYEVESFKEEMFDSDFNGIVLKFERVFNIAF
jgi:hypothetical protein